ncbi:MAG: cell division protein ZapA [Nitrosospira sp.]|nr:cell division protein ZapA [Nitrosospira sp.]
MEQQAALHKAANHLNDKMQQIQKTGKVIGTERCAIMAALNISHELLELQGKTVNSSRMTSQLQALTQKLEAAVQEQKQLL